MYDGCIGEGQCLKGPGGFSILSFPLNSLHLVAMLPLISIKSEICCSTIAEVLVDSSNKKQFDFASQLAVPELKPEVSKELVKL